jgi:hypothetical protein
MLTGIRERDRIYGGIVQRQLHFMGIPDRPAAPESPWQVSSNG